MISVAAQSCKVELTASKAEVKCSIEEGITRDEHLRCENKRKGPGSHFELRTEKAKKNITHSDQRSDSTDTGESDFS